jgi:prolyl oligopeptidase
LRPQRVHIDGNHLFNMTSNCYTRTSVSCDRCSDTLNFMRVVALALTVIPLMIAQSPPKSKVENVTDDVHGVKIVDPFRWLENQDSPETRQWIEEQTKYTKSVLGPVPGREKIAKRLSELLRIDTMSPVANRGGRLFYWKRKAEQNQPVLFMGPAAGGEEKILIDPNAMSKDGQISAQVFDVSKDGKLLAYALQNGGEDEVVVKFRNLDTNQDLPIELPRTRYWSLSLELSAKAVYYVRYDTKGPRLMWRSLSDTTGQATKEIFGDGLSEEFGLACSMSDNGRYLVVTKSKGWATSDVYVYDIAKAAMLPVAVGLNERFEGIPGGDNLFLFTTWKAPSGRVLSVPFAEASFEKLTEIIPQREATLETVITAGGKLVLNYLENASSKVRIHNVDGSLLRELKLPGMGTASGPSGDWDQDEAWYGFTSFGQPNTWYTYKISTGEQKVFFKPDVPVDPSQTEVTQVWVTSKDKTKIPMFLFHKKGLKPNSKTPVELYGYGGFNVNLTPSFSATNQVWIEMGGVYAVPNLRGGGEFGEKWHKAGMFENKQNVFDDFIAAGEWLIEHGYGSKKTLSISGGSNGGLLVGAAMTQRPDLFQAVVCAVPLLDMVRYHQFKVAKLWVPEYGSSEDPKQFEYIYKYSPYHHVKKGEKYPAVMFVTGDSDTRVDPLHARKMAALMQANTGSKNPILLHYDTKSGHAGGKPVNKTIEDSTDLLVFLGSQLGASLP